MSKRKSNVEKLIEDAIRDLSNIYTTDMDRLSKYLYIRDAVNRLQRARLILGETGEGNQ